MTVRAVILGLLGAAFVGATGFYNDMVMRQTTLYTGYMPALIFGVLVIFVAFMNPALGRLYRGAALRGSEIAMAMAIVLPSCYISSHAYVHRLSVNMMAPRVLNTTQSGWKQHRIMDRMPQILLAGVEPYVAEDQVTDAPALCAALAEDPAPSRPGISALRGALSPDDITEIKTLLGSVPADPDDCAAAAAHAINRVLPRRDLFSAEDMRGAAAPLGADELFAGVDLPEVTILRLNRQMVDIACEGTIVGFSALEDRAVTGYRLGLSEGQDRIGFSDVPWFAWKRSLSYWIPITMAFCAVFMGLAMVSHRRFREHELFPYPIATFALEMLPPKSTAPGGILRSRAFWIAAAAVALFHLNNYAFLFWPDHMVELPRHFNFNSLKDLVPILNRGPNWGLFSFTVFFTAVGLAYLMARDVSFSVGIAPWVYTFIVGLLAIYGIEFRRGGYNSLRTDIFVAAAAYFGLFGIIVYTGRHHYKQVFARSLFLRKDGDARPHEVLGGRIVIVASIVFIVMCVAVGMKLHWAVLFLAMLIMIWAPIGRIVAETGLFVVHPHIFPTVLIWAFFGAQFFGIDQMMIMFMLGGFFALGMHMNVMPMFDHGMALNKGRPGSAAGFGAAGLLIAVAIAVPLAIYLQYDHGYLATSSYSNQVFAAYPFKPIVALENRLEAQGLLSEVGTTLTTHWPSVLAFFVALAMVLGTEALRLRLPWWPIHPIIFICAGWTHSRILGASFLIGCLIKTAVTKYGGIRGYNQVRPVMIGIIAGDMIAGVAISVISYIYYLVTGTPPESMSVLWA